MLGAPSLGQDVVNAQECGTAGCCSGLISGARCQYTSNSCAGGYVDNYCPGGTTYKCCIPTTTACYNNYNRGKCQTVGGTQACSTSYVSNQCPGPTNVRCCVGTAPPPPPPPPPTATPTRTPTPTATPTPANSQRTTTPGIIFTGSATPNFGRGQASVRNWVVGGLSYPERFPTANNPSTTSYQYILDKANSAKIPVIDMATQVTGCSTLTNCTLPANLASGVYHANGNLNLNSHNFPVGRNYVFLIFGDLTIQGGIGTPIGSTVLFSASRDIDIASNVGAASNSLPLPSGQVQGLFSANRHFGVVGIGDCIIGPDRMLNIDGAIAVNASGTGGSFTNQRDLCGLNPTIPSVTIRSRMDMLLNMPEFLMKRTTIYREEDP